MIPFPKPLRQFLATVALLVFLVVGVTGASDTVMCYGSDGHVALEALGSRGCSDFVPKTPTQASPSKALVVNDHCGGCVDIPLLSWQGMSEQSVSVLSDNPTFEKQSLVWAEPLPVPAGYISRLVEQQMPHPPPLLLRSSVHTFLDPVILLI